MSLAFIAVFAGWLLAENLAQAADPTLQLRLPFTQLHGSGTTTPSDTSSGGMNISLTMKNPSSVATDLNGYANSGVNGPSTGIAAMDFTSDLVSGQGGTQPAAGNGDIAVDLNDSTLAAGLGNGGGIITNFVVTMWFKQVAMQPGNTGPRMWILNAGTAGVDSGANANTIGMKFQGNNQMYLQIGADTVTVGPPLANPFPTNQWLFIAVAYDSTNATMYYGSDNAVAQLIGTGATLHRSVTLGSSACLSIGNRTALSRGFNGWINDFRFYSGDVSTNTLAFVEKVRQSIAPPLPTIVGVYPDGAALMQNTNTLVFTALSSGVNNFTNISLVLNGVNVSAGLTFVTNGTAGTSTNVTASYTGLPQQAVNTAVISAINTLGLVGTVTVNFDTFNPTNFIVKAEEFDFNYGQYIDNPVYTNVAEADSYYGLNSVEEVDTHKGPSVGDSQATAYRYDDGSGTQTQTPLAAGELPSPTRFGGSVVPGHMISYWSSGEWQNYTKTFPAGNYNVWTRLSTSSGSTVNFDQVTGGQGTTSQPTSRLGQFTLSGNSGFQWVELMQNGSPAVVNLGGVNTVRATTGGGANANFYMLAPANSNLPIISNVNPNGAYLFQYPSGGNLTFTVSSTVTTIHQANVTVTVNGNVLTLPSTDFSPQTDPSPTFNVTVPAALAMNNTIPVTIHVLDDNGGTATAQLTIDTWNPVLQIEAEDFDFDPNLSPISAGNGLRFIDNPVSTSVPTTLGVYQITATNSYEGQTGDAAIDESGVGAGTRPYRPGNVATAVVVDTPRAQFAHNQDFNVGFLGAGFWEDYTRTYGAGGSAPAGTYNLYGRMASGASASGLPTPPGIRDDVSLVVAGYGTTNQITSYLGRFTIPTTNGYSSYSYIPLIDRFGNYAQLTLSGAETLRSMLDLTTTTGLAQFGLNINFYMLTAARTDQARIDSVYPNGTTQQQQTNTLSFVASSPTYGINTTNIQVTLNGVNISSNLVFSGSSGSWNVSYPGLQYNTSYTAVITVTDNNNQTHTATVNFDTFNPNNYTWEAEDYDFDPTLSPVPNGSGLRYIDNPALTSVPATNSYLGQQGDGGQLIAPIDYAAIFGTGVPAGAAHIYRPLDFIATEVTGDTLRPKYQNAQLTNDNPYIVDYDVNYWATNGWINYTRTFPTGNFYLVARLSAGNGAFNLQCTQVTNGAGTASQMTNYLGSFKGSGTSFATWQDVYLTDAATNKIILPFGGVETLQFIGDYNEDVNYFELVPLTPLSPVITASVSGSNIQLSFPTQIGFSYTMYYKNNLTDPSWTQLGSPVPGNGAIESVTDSNILLSQNHRFYRLTIQ